MVRTTFIEGRRIHTAEFNATSLKPAMELEERKVVWVDLVDASEGEKEQVEELFGIELFTTEESEEIETSSKFIENDVEVGINLNFLKAEGENYVTDTVSFILKDDILVSQREFDYKTFISIYRRLHGLNIKEGQDIFFAVLDTRIDYDADLIENITEQISVVSKHLVKKEYMEKDMLLRIASLQDTTIAIRENIIEKQRILSAILKSRFFPVVSNENLLVMIKDVQSLVDHISFNFERLEYLQNTFLGLVDMEQNRVIKIFTIATVVFMPPTLIAGIYGMNFTFMPELKSNLGYPTALALMLTSSLITLLFFKLKKWL